MTWRVTSIVKTPKGKVYKGTPVKLEPTGYATRSGGVGGWETLDRPRRNVAIAWVGGTEETLVLPGILDGVDALGPQKSRSVEKDRQRIESWGKKDERGGEPPRLQVTGVRGVAATSRWVVQDIEWGDSWENSGGALIQQEVTLTLLRWREPTLSSGPAKRARARKPKKGKK